MPHHPIKRPDDIVSFRKLSNILFMLRHTEAEDIGHGRKRFTVHGGQIDTALNAEEMELLQCALRSMPDNTHPPYLHPACTQTEAGLVFEFNVENKAPSHRLDLTLLHIKEELANAHFIGDMWAMDDARIHLKLPPATVMAISQQLQADQRSR